MRSAVAKQAVASLQRLNTAEESTLSESLAATVQELEERFREAEERAQTRLQPWLRGAIGELRIPCFD